MFTQLQIPLNWWLPSATALSCFTVLAAVLWLGWRARRLRAEGDAAAQARRIVLGFTVAALLWLGYGVYFIQQHFGMADPLVLFAQQAALQRQPLIIGGIAWCAALLVARLLASVRSNEYE